MMDLILQSDGAILLFFLANFALVIFCLPIKKKKFAIVIFYYNGDSQLSISYILPLQLILLVLLKELGITYLLKVLDWGSMGSWWGKWCLFVS